VEWLFRNHSGKQFRALEDLNGLWLYILNARGKKAATLKKNGLPIEVSIVGNKARAYVIQEKHRNGGLDSGIRAQLQDRGFKVREIPQEKPDKNGRKGYILEEPDPPKKTLAYIDVEAGGQKIFRKYTVVEGTGTSLELLDMGHKVDNTKELEDEGGSALIHEMQAASKSFLVILAEAMQGAFKSLILPLIAGVGMGGMIVFLVLMLTGHTR
jgi:hypothetical protein